MALQDKAIEEVLSILIQRAVDIHENSWSPATFPDGTIDQYGVMGHYEISQYVACHMAGKEIGVSKELQILIYYLLQGNWNIARDWAENIRSAIHGPKE